MRKLVIVILAAATLALVAWLVAFQVAVSIRLRGRDAVLIVTR